MINQIRVIVAPKTRHGREFQHVVETCRQRTTEIENDPFAACALDLDAISTDLSRPTMYPYTHRTSLLNERSTPTV